MMISIICPFYNEELILEKAVRRLLACLADLDDPWELIIVNDGSTDGSKDIAKGLVLESDKIKLVGYARNRGRGYAIRQGVSSARGDILVTTEIDLSWGDNIVHRLVAEMKRRPESDVIVASPNLAGGGYKNVPWSRVLASRVGNFLFRKGLGHGITMNTGMTRCYRRDMIQALPLDEDGKELHLEIIAKAVALGHQIHEIPATIEWKESKYAKKPGVERKSSTKMGGVIKTHSVFIFFISPFRYIYVLTALIALAAFVFLGWAVHNLATEQPSIFLLQITMVLFLAAFIALGGGILAQQLRAIQRDLWVLRSERNSTRDVDAE